MSISVTSVCNSALIKVGADRISDIDQSTKGAIVLKAIFDTCRDDVLRAHPWHFAVTRVTLSPNATVPPYEYDYTFDMPTDCLRVLEPYTFDVEFVTEGRTLLSNESTLDVRYIQRIEDPSVWDACFAEALAWRLARDISYSLAQSAALTNTCSVEYKRALSEARSISGMEGTIAALEADIWANSRK